MVSGRRGVTLLEVLIVIIIISMILGLSLLLLSGANRDLGVRASTNHCVALIRSVVEHARSNRVPAWVVINLQENSVYTLTEEVVQAWNFEDGTGAFGQTVTLGGPQLVPGREGLAYPLSGTNALRCPPVPVYAPGQGVGLECWIRPGSKSGRMTILSIGGGTELWIEGGERADRPWSASVKARVGGLELDSRAVRIPADQWTHLRAMTNGLEGKLFINGVEVDARAGRSTWGRAEPLAIGAAQRGFVGLVDSVRVSVVVPRDKYYPPGETRFVMAGGPQEVRGEFVIGFTSEGKLDGARHAGPVTFSLKSPVEEQTITVSLWGGILR